MTLENDPFVTSAREDLAEGRLRTMPVGDLAADGVTEAADLDLSEEHVVTETFLSLWKNLSRSATAATTLLSVMHGIRIEPRHPAYRVIPTTYPHLFQAQAGHDTILVFSSHEGSVVWLAVLRSRRNE